MPTDGLHQSTSLDHSPLAGSLVADAVSMPVHWYYDRDALRRDYGVITGYLAPRSPHPDSILWRSHYEAANERGDILRDEARFWGQRGVHYHQHLKAGENTLNARLALELAAMIREEHGYDADRWLERYIDFMLTPGRHRDTYVEEYHRIFFTNYAAGVKPRNCGGKDVHIGGLVPVPAIVEAMRPLRPSLAELRRVVQEHVSLTHRDQGVLRAADALVRMLVRLEAGEGLRDTMLDEAADWISRAKTADWDRFPDEIVVGRVLSPACYIPDAFPAALFLAWRHAGDFREGVCGNARVGGDNCHRGAVVGSLLAASAGVPDDLLGQLAAGPRLREVLSEPPPAVVTIGSRIYETDSSVAQYLDFHYGPVRFGVPNFPQACIEVAASFRGHGERWSRALDVGCAVGRASLELAREVEHVDAIDFSAAFIDACQRLQAGPVDYTLPTEGELREQRTASLAAHGLDATATRVRFSVGDACRLPSELREYDVVFAGNLIDRLYDPLAFLEGIVPRLRSGGLLVITSPYTWLADYTPPDRWLGGRIVDGEPRTTLEGMRQALAGRCELVGQRDIPFVIRETARKHQHTLAEASFWRRL